MTYLEYVEVDEIKYSLTMAKILKLERKLSCAGLDGILNAVGEGGHKLMADCLAVMADIQPKNGYFDGWTPGKVQDTFQRALNVSLFGQEDAPETDVPLDQTAG